jgi:hypothetical protein
VTVRSPGILIEPQGVVFEHDLEYQYFMEFRERTAAQIAGHYDAGVWSRLIPQVCHQEASIRSVICGTLSIKIRTLHESRAILVPEKALTDVEVYIGISRLLLLPST